MHATTWPRFLACLITLAPAAPLGADGLLQNRCTAIVRSRDLGETTVSVLVQDLSDNEVLAQINPHARMIPASNMKLITTAAALKLLGADFEFRTELRLIEDVPSPDDGAAATPGMVAVIVGDGDPALGDPKVLSNHNLDIDQMLEAWVQVIKNAGVEHLSRLAVDDRVFDQAWVHPDWPRDQLNRWYCAQVAGLNIHENCVYVYPRPTQVGHSPRIMLRPAAKFISGLARNRSVTDRRDTFWVSRKLNTNELTYRGKIRHKREKPVKVALHDPPLFMARLLAEQLRAAGVRVDHVDRAGPEEQFPPSRPLLRWVTPIQDVLRRCNKDSQNLFAEALIKRVGRHVTGARGSWETGAAAVRMFLQQRLGPNAAVVNISDGSGMSRNNRITARTIVNLLHIMHRDTPLAGIYRDSLAIGGVDGTLRKRFGGALNGTVHGKSGFINGVCTLSGYLVSSEEDREPRVVAFSLLFNDIKAPVYVHDIKKLQGELISTIDRHIAPPVEVVELGG